MAGFRPGTSSGSAALPESGGGLKKPFDDLESGSKHGTGLISGVQGVFKEAVMSLVPPHIRRKGFVLPPLRVRRHAPPGWCGSILVTPFDA